MKVDTKEIVTKLREAGVDEKLIPALVMTAYYESNLNSLAVNTNPNKSKDYGLFQINSASFYKEDYGKNNATKCTEKTQKCNIKIIKNKQIKSPKITRIRP